MQTVCLRIVSIFAAVSLLLSSCTAQTISGSGSAAASNVVTNCRVIEPLHDKFKSEIVIMPQVSEIKVGLKDCVSYDGINYTVVYQQVSYSCPSGLTCFPEIEPVPSEIKLPDGNFLGWVPDAHPRTYNVKQGEQVTLAQLRLRYPDFAESIFFKSAGSDNDFPDQTILPPGAVVYVG